MCRICGFIDYSNKYTADENDQILTAMRDSMQIGGPDDEGNYLETTGDTSIAFGHRRLSIIDVSACGHQPMLSDDGEIIITYNGEIYNYKEVKKELEANNIQFNSASDTEVIIQAYKEWGIDCVNKFIGMFAFALLDKKINKIFLVRDRAGVKPMHYYFDGNIFMFASELKAFHKHPKFIKEIDPDTLGMFFQFSNILAPYTIFKNTKKLQPGHYLTLDLINKKITEHKYWDVIDFYELPKIHLPENEIVEKTEALLRSACNYRMVADVPVGVFLSGGYDSSLVTALLQSDSTAKIKTFSIGFNEKKFDESKYAKNISEYLGTEHYEYTCSAQNAIDVLPLLPTIYDEPFGDSSAIPTILVSKIARQQVKVALSADGGDEIFGGYNKYEGVINLYNKINKIPLLKQFAKMLKGSKASKFFAGHDLNYISNKLFSAEKYYNAASMSEMLYYSVQLVNEIGLNKLLNRASQPKTETNFTRHNFFHDRLDENINFMLATDYITYLPDTILTKVDRATMSVSLEGREPLLDHRLIEWMAQLPADLKIKNGSKKYLLKEIAHKYIPREMLDRPKMGFGVPIELWFNDVLKEYFENYLSDKKLKEHDLLNIGYVSRIMNEYYKGKKQNIYLLWNILMFQMWYEKWMTT